MAGPDKNLVPGIMYCAKCNFRLVRKNLYMQSGTVGPGNSKTETCPNGCGPLWPISWEQEARKGYNLLDSCHRELENIKQEKQSLAEMHDALIKEYSNLRSHQIASAEAFWILSQLPTAAPFGPDKNWMNIRNSIAKKLEKIHKIGKI